MDFESPDVEKEFPGLYASDPLRQSQDRESDFSDESHDKPSKKDLLIGKRKEKKESKKDKGYVAFEEESSGEELDPEQRSPTKSRKTRSAFKFSKRDKSKEKNKEKKEEKKEEKEKEKKKEIKVKLKLKDRKKSKHPDEDIDKDDRIIFGVPLHVAVERSKCHDGIELPAIVRECVDYIEEHGLSCEGIYRLSGVKSKVQKLRNNYNCGERVCLSDHEPHIVASLLKLFLRELPDAVLTQELIPKFEEASVMKDSQKRIEILKKLIEELPSCNRLLLSWIFVHMMHIIQREHLNKMNVQNVSIVLSPTMQISHRVLNTLFTHGAYLFKDVALKKYVPPMKPEMSRSSLELPDSPSAIQDEIVKQESLLSQIHADVQSARQSEKAGKGTANQEKEEQLWEVQRIVTQLKRKLRLANRAQEVEREIKNAIAAPAASEELQLDTRLQTMQQKKTSPLKENVRHKCTVFVPWQQNDKFCENHKENTTANNEKPEETAESEVIFVPIIAEDKLSSSHPGSSDEADVVVANSLKVKVDGGQETTVPESQESLNGDVPDSIQEPGSGIDLLVEEEKTLLVQQVELEQLAGELRRKIETERFEVERLKTKIGDLRTLYRYRSLSYDSAENSSDEECSDSDEEGGRDDEEEETEESLLQIILDLQDENKSIEQQNGELIGHIQQEREACLEAKVQIRLIQKNHNGKDKGTGIY